MFTLRPWLTRWSRFHQDPETRTGVCASPWKACRADSAARAAFYKEMWYLGVFSTNDIRALEELPPVEGGNVRYRPLNMGELGSTDDTSQGVPNA